MIKISDEWSISYAKLVHHTKCDAEVYNNLYYLKNRPSCQSIPEHINIEQFRNELESLWSKLSSDENGSISITDESLIRVRDLHLKFSPVIVFCSKCEAIFPDKLKDKAIDLGGLF